MTFLKTYGILFVSLLACACTRQAPLDTTAKTTESGALAGTWEWLVTDGGIGHNIHITPASTGKTIFLNLGTDSSYAFMVNNAVTAQGTYSIEQRTCIHDKTQKPYLRFSGCPGLMIEKGQADTLTLADENSDGVESKYKRVATGAW